MRFRGMIFVRRVAAVVIVFFLLAVPASGQSFTGVVEAVKNGDTILVLRSDRVLTMRLAGLDAPELSQPYGERAAHFLRQQIGGEKVRVRVRERDQLGRLVATVIHGRREVNEQLLRAGLAWYYWDYEEYAPDAARDQALEYRAQRAGRGLWAQAAPIPPWQWRDADRGRRGSRPKGK